MKDFVNKEFVGAKLKDEHLFMLEYAVSMKDDDGNTMSIANAFQTLERAKTEYNLDDYSFSQTTLEQVNTLL